MGNINPNKSRKFDYPPSRVEDVVEDHFGVTVHDPYRWLEDGASSEVRQWASDQDRFARQSLASFPTRPNLVKRFQELYYIDRISAPVKRRGRLFFTKRDANSEKAVLYCRDLKTGEDRVLIDPNELSKEGNVSLGKWVPSHDGKKIAYTLKPNNADEATLYVMDVARGVVSKRDVIEGAKYATPQWTPKGDGFYYTWLSMDPKIPDKERLGFAEIRFHKIGTDPKNDKTIFNKTGDPKKYPSVELSHDGRWLIVTVRNSWSSWDVYFKDEKRNSSRLQPLVVGGKSKSYVVPWSGSFYIMTNDGSPKQRIDKADASRPGREFWKTIVPERSDTVIDDMSIVGRHLILRVLKNASASLEIYDLDGKFIRRVETPGIGNSGMIVGDPHDDAAYYSYESFITPQKIFMTSMSSGKTELWAETKAPVDPSQYIVEQVWYPSKDKTPVSMYIIRKKDAPKDGSTPFILTGYGGFNISITPTYAPGIYPWIEAGGGYALANLRGGGEYGEEWHRAGMLANKQNVFDDFIAGAEYLIREGYTRSEKLAALGGSAAGLLVGAAVTQRPELFGAAACSIPYLDMVRFHKFGIGSALVGELGSPENEDMFRVLYGYSPYHRVMPGTDYPAMLFLANEKDDRIDPMHARKMTAAMQAASGSGRPVYLRVQKDAGHGGADQVKMSVEKDADVFSFLMMELGVWATPR